jgi:membrane-associated phospholipid phosphatase
MAAPFERRAIWVYRLILAELAAAAVLVAFTGFHLTVAAVATLPFWAFSLAGAAMLLRAYGHPRFSGGMEAIALVYGQGFAILFLLFPLTALSWPFADDWLAKADYTVGFDWPLFASLLANRLTVQHGIAIAYHSFNWQPLIIIPALFLTGRDERAWQFVLAGTIAALVAALVYPFAPALGTFHHYSIQAAEFPNLRSAWQFGPVIQSIKDGARTISPNLFTGFVSFPSYHAAAALIFVWAMWPFRVWRPVFVLLNLAMCGAAMIAGGHYFVDILAGWLVASVSIWLASRAREGRRGDSISSVGVVASCILGHAQLVDVHAKD